MKLIMENWKRFLKEQPSNSNLKIIEGEPFCIGAQCRADVRAVDIETSKVVAAAGARGKTKEEALNSAREKLKAKLKKLKTGG